MSKAIIDLGFGDSGKGILTDYMCSLEPNPLVIRYSGGQQAGHTVCYNNIRHVFSNFGSGTLRGAPTYWSEYCTIDPVGIMNEYKVLIEKGIKPKLFINPNCPVTTPYEKYRSKDSDYMNNGTCGVGVGATIQREEDHYSLKYLDLHYDSVYNEKFNLIEVYYNNKHPFYRRHVKDSFKIFFEACKFIVENSDITVCNYDAILYKYNIIFEGSQGLMLDQNIGFFPHVTRSNTGSKNILKITDKYKYVMNMSYPYTVYVTRAYQTRHGNGPMTNEDIPYDIKENPLETNKQHKYQGKFRKSMLDLDLLKYAINKDNCGENGTTLAITCLDHLDNYKFTYEGKVIDCGNKEDDFINNISDILDIKWIIRSRSDKTENIEDTYE